MRAKALLAVVPASAVLATLAALAVAGSTPAAPREPGSVAQTGGSGWSADVKHLRGRNNQRFTYVCPAGGTARTVWGTYTYTDDSSVCTAAVHRGLITFARGGIVTIEVRPGRSSYAGSRANGVTTRSYGSWAGSFIVVRATSAANTLTGGSGWTANAKPYRGRNFVHYAYTCPRGGSPGTVWGSGLYTDDSSVCTAGVHAGLITLAGGGLVIIEIRPGAPSYASSSRNGIATRSYGAWSGSFVFIVR